MEALLGLQAEASQIYVRCLPVTCRMSISCTLDSESTLRPTDYRRFGELCGLSPREILALRANNVGRSVTEAIFQQVFNTLTVWDLMCKLSEMGVDGVQDILGAWQEIRENVYRERAWNAGHRYGVQNICTCLHCSPGHSNIGQLSGQSLGYPSGHQPSHHQQAGFCSCRLDHPCPDRSDCQGLLQAQPGHGGSCRRGVPPGGSAATVLPDRRESSDENSSHQPTTHTHMLDRRQQIHTTEFPSHMEGFIPPEDFSSACESQNGAAWTNYQASNVRSTNGNFPDTRNLVMVCNNQRPVTVEGCRGNTCLIINGSGCNGPNCFPSQAFPETFDHPEMQTIRKTYSTTELHCRRQVQGQGCTNGYDITENLGIQSRQQLIPKDSPRTQVPRTRADHLDGFDDHSRQPLGQECSPRTQELGTRTEQLEGLENHFRQPLGQENSPRTQELGTRTEQVEGLENHFRQPLGQENSPRMQELGTRTEQVEGLKNHFRQPLGQENSPRTETTRCTDKNKDSIVSQAVKSNIQEGSTQSTSGDAMNGESQDNRRRDDGMGENECVKFRENRQRQPHRQSGEMMLISHPQLNQVEGRAKYVFITGGEKRKKQDVDREMRSICKMLYKRHNVHVVADLPSGLIVMPGDPLNVRRNLRGNIHEEINDYFNNATCILLAISPDYKKYVEQNGSSRRPSGHRTSTRFIYTQMINEYCNRNFSRNKRFYPVMLQNIGGRREHIPDWLSSTLTYTFPANNTELFRHLKDDLGITN